MSVSSQPAILAADSHSQVVFADCSSELLQAYVECGEGLDRYEHSFTHPDEALTLDDQQGGRICGSRAGRLAGQARRGRLQQRRRLPWTGASPWRDLRGGEALTARHSQAFIEWLSQLTEEGTLLELD